MVGVSGRVITADERRKKSFGFRNLQMSGLEPSDDAQDSDASDID
jgi:hypothetical protein